MADIVVTLDVDIWLPNYLDIADMGLGETVLLSVKDDDTNRLGDGKLWEPKPPIISKVVIELIPKDNFDAMAIVYGELTDITNELVYLKTPDYQTILKYSLNVWNILSYKIHYMDDARPSRNTIFTIFEQNKGFRELSSALEDAILLVRNGAIDWAFLVMSSKNNKYIVRE